jgi:rhamnulokinase
MLQQRKLDAKERTWSKTLIQKFSIPSHILQDIVPPGTILGGLLPEVSHFTGISPETPVIAPATHDTACAVAAIPILDTTEPWAYHIQWDMVIIRDRTKYEPI